MRVHVQAFATLRPFLPQGTLDTAVLDLADGSTIQDLLRFLGVPDEMSVIALLNGRETELTHAVRSGDVVTLFPPLAGGECRRSGAAASEWYTRGAAGSV